MMVINIFHPSLLLTDFCILPESPDIMYKKIINNPLIFPDVVGSEARSILTGLLSRDASVRLGANGAEEIKNHPFFLKHIDFKKLLAKKIQPPFKPKVASAVVSRFIHSRFSNMRCRWLKNSFLIIMWKKGRFQFR